MKVPGSRLITKVETADKKAYTLLADAKWGSAPAVAIAKFLKGWTVYFFDGRVGVVFH
jgi:hypothetical protein